MFVSNTSALTGAQAGDDFPESETAGWLFDPLPAHSCDPLMIDPPWPFGKPRKFTLPSCFDGIAREHSRKPEEFYQMITERAPDLRRVDVFAREKREGWDAWGDEVEKFSPQQTRTPEVIDQQLPGARNA
jgi:hypothetical protein